MKAINFGGTAFVVVAGSFTVVGMAQSLLADRYGPRWVSVFAGISYYLVIALWEGVGSGNAPYFFHLLFSAAVSGSMMGYFCGVLVGGVFLVSEFLRTKILGREPTKLEDERNNPPESPWEE